MKEPELLENLSKLERTSKVLEIKIKVWKDEKGKQDLIKRNEVVKAEIEKLKRNLAPINGNKEKESREANRNNEPKSTKTPKTVEETKSNHEHEAVEKLKVSEELKSTEKEIRNDLAVNNNGYKQLTELEILKTLCQLEKDSHFLEIKIRTGNEEKRNCTWTKENEAIKAKIEELKKNLSFINDKRYGEEAKYAIIRQLKEYISKINDAGKGRIESKLFEKIYNGLYFFMADKSSRGSIPSFSSYKPGADNPVDTKELYNFLIQEIQTVTNIDEPGYSNLREYLAGLKDRIIKRFID